MLNTALLMGFGLIFHDRYDVKTSRIYPPSSAPVTARQGRADFASFCDRVKSTEKFMNLRKTASLVLQLLVLSTLGFGQGVASGDLHVIMKDPK